MLLRQNCIFGVTRGSKIRILWQPTNRRKLSTSSEAKELIVYRSTCEDVLENLSFEEYLYSSVDLKKRNIVFLWRNTPSVVIGRFQNPWAECNVSIAKEKEIVIARRRSGGGAVFHDLGNLNCTVITERSGYNRRFNLLTVVKAIREYQQCYDLEVNARDDIMTKDGFKVSGTAARLGLSSAYHHFTLLCNVNMENLHGILTPSVSLLESTATKSLKSKTKNIFPKGWDYVDLTCFIANEFARRLSSEDCNIIDVNPAAASLPVAFHNLKNEMSSWGWIFGKTPKFTVKSRVMLEEKTAEINIEVDKGVIKNCEIFHEDPRVVKETKPIVSSLSGEHYYKPTASVVLSQVLNSVPRQSRINLAIVESVLSCIP